MPRWFGRASLLVALHLAGACTTLPTLSANAVLLEIPEVRQNELWECGLAALDALIGYYGVEMPADRRVSLQRAAHERHGLSGEELARQLEALGFTTFVFASNLDHEPTGLLHHLDARRPSIVMTRSMFGERHFVLVHGYDAEQALLCILDPLRGAQFESWTSFELMWNRAERFTLLAVPGKMSTTE